MSKKSNNSSKPKTKRRNSRVDRPFAPAILKQARQIAGRYRIILEPSEELGFIGRAWELPTGFAHGATPDECVEATRKGVTAAVATMLEAGRRPPAPASRARRQAQINIRVSAEEKMILEETARRNGFRGVSDYIRATALGRAGAGTPEEH